MVSVSERIRTVRVLTKAPGRPHALYCASTYPSLPGGIGSRLQFGEVHPQEVLTSTILMGCFCVFLKVKRVVATLSSSLILPKSCSVLANCTREVDLPGSAVSPFSDLAGADFFCAHRSIPLRAMPVMRCFHIPVQRYAKAGNPRYFSGGLGAGRIANDPLRPLKG